MAILTNKPSSINGNSTTSITLSTSDLKTSVSGLTNDAYWNDTSVWKAVTFLYKNVDSQSYPLSFNLGLSSSANLIVPSTIRNETLLCQRIDISGFNNDCYTIYRTQFSSPSVFDISVTNGYSPVIQLPTTLVLYHFDGNQNGAYGNNLNVYGSPSYVSGKFNQAATGFSNSSYFDVDASFVSSIGSGAFCIEFFAKFDPAQAVVQSLLAIGPVSGNAVIDVVAACNNNSFLIFDQFFNGNGFGGFTTWQDGNWHHICLQRGRNSSLIDIYIDGVYKGNTGFMTANLGSNLILTVGKDANGWAFKGSMDELRISNALMYNKDLTTNTFTPPSSPLT